MNDVERIIEFVCKYYGLSKDQMMSRRKAAEYTHPRMVAMYIARKSTEISYPELGKIFGRDHSTVLNAVQRMSDNAKAIELERQFAELTV